MSIYTTQEGFNLFALHLCELFDINYEEILIDYSVDVEKTNVPSPFKGQKHTEESKKKIGAAHLGKIVSEETRNKISAMWVGKPGRKPKGTPTSAETKSKISAAKTNPSSETREKLRQAQLRRWSLYRERVEASKRNE